MRRVGYRYSMRYVNTECAMQSLAGIIDGDYRYLALDDIEGDVFQVAVMNTLELNELVNMYNRSCSHIDFDRLPGPLCMICLLLLIFVPLRIIKSATSYLAVIRRR